jgi:exopolysaccharide biosynthesis polyprenyl glycosylphosphotransferase
LEQPGVTSFPRSDHQRVLLLGDLAALSTAVIVSLWLWSLTAGFPFSVAFVRDHAIWFLAVPAWALALTPVYSPRLMLSPGRTAAALLQAATLLAIAYFSIYFYAPRQGLPRLMALYIVWEGFLLVLAWRLTCAWFFGQDPFTRRVLIVGGGEPGAMALALLRDQDFRNSTVVGVFDSDDPRNAGRNASLTASVRELGANEIVVADAGAQTELFSSLVDCQELGIEITTMPQVYEDLLHRVPVRHLESSWLFTSFVEAVRAKDASLLAKRALDIIGALVGLVVLVILAPLIVLAIWVDSGRPIFFGQLRAGRGGRDFRILKFRTMMTDAERETGPQWSTHGDPRITRVGRILRKLRIDELPNLVNVLRGEMSLVGPRPERPELVVVLARDIPFYRTRLLVRPGLTGWAQVNHPYGGSVDDAVEKLEYDLYYLKHRSMLFDLRILLRTVGTVFRFEGR